MSLCRITAAQKVGQMPGEASVSFWVSHVSVWLFFCLSQLYCQLLFCLADVGRWWLNRQELENLLRDRDGPRVSSGWRFIFSLFIRVSAHTARCCGCSRAHRASGNSRGPQAVGRAAPNGTVRLCYCAAADRVWSNTEQRRREHAQRHGAPDARAFTVSSPIEEKLLEVSCKLREREKKCRSEETEGAARHVLRCTESQAVMGRRVTRLN